MSSAAFWRGKRVFLTGHTGFKGSWAALWLQQLGAEVTGYALAPPSSPNLFEVARVAQGMRSLEGDVRDGADLLTAMTGAAPDIVIHMAAQSLVRLSYDQPVATYATNVMGTVHLLEAVRQTPSVRAVVNVTSDKCYQNNEWNWGYRENEPMGGHDPYSNSKGCAELVTAAYRDSFFSANSAGIATALASARAGNVIGGGDWAADRLIPDIFRAIEAGRPVNIRNRNSVRPWQHVLEPLHGYLTLAERLFSDGTAFAKGWNFGPSDEDAKPVGWIVDHLTSQWGTGASWALDERPQPHEARYLKLDCSMARDALGWRSKWPLAEALSQIIAWHRAYLKGADMRDVTLAQIAQHQTTRGTAP